MQNVVAVTLALLGLYATLWGFGVDARVAAGFVGLALTVASVALLVDVEEML